MATITTKDGTQIYYKDGLRALAAFEPKFLQVYFLIRCGLAAHENVFAQLQRCLAQGLRRTAPLLSPYP